MKEQIKIGLITLSASDNCGSCLQAYALKKILENYGAVEIINFSSPSSHRMYDLPKLSLNDLFSLLFDRDFSRNRKRIKRCKKAYASFRTNYMGIDVSNEILPDSLELVADKYDVYVTGSDQVWNVEMQDFDEAFFLWWTKRKKVAYAPSLGGRDVRVSSKSAQYIDWINEFEFLSVREEIGLNCLNEITSKNITKALDPTLLLAESDWVSLVGKSLYEGNYIFFYSWAYCYEEELQIVKAESIRLGLPVIVIDSRKWIDKNTEDYGFILSQEEGPLAFLNLMYYAKLTFVESFHGMVFSYIFKKNFWLLDNHKNLNDLDSRLKEFVDLLCAHDRILTPYNYSNKNIDKEMEYKKNIQLDHMRESSLKFLNEALSK